MNTVDAYLYTTKPLKDVKGPSEGTTDSVDTLENVAAVYPATRCGILALWEAIWDDVEENRVTLKNVNDDQGDAMEQDDRIRPDHEPGTLLSDDSERPHDLEPVLTGRGHPSHQHHQRAIRRADPDRFHHLLTSWKQKKHDRQDTGHAFSV